MKKLMLTLIAISGLVALDATAGYRRCLRRCDYVCDPCYKPCKPEKVCVPCAEPCKVDKIVEEACPVAPCCVRYVKVEEPALITKHISYSWECPAGCTPEQQAAGMMKAGDSGSFSGQ